MKKLKILKKYFGHTQFRNGQEQIVDSLLSNRDVLAIMPTGAGKSVCYQVPALMSDGITLVISPLISLMKDQVSALTQSGISAAFINSSLNMIQYKKVIERMKNNEYKIIYVAPERLGVQAFVSACCNIKISIVAVDEAHCVSQWGQDFRPSYLKITEFIKRLPKRPVVGAFTATATKEVKDDIQSMLRLDNPFTITTGFDRPNLYFGVRKPKSKMLELFSIIDEHKNECGIVYCSTRKKVDEVCDLLIERGYSATSYHAGLDDGIKKKNQEDFVFDNKNIMVATNAFGMGIDKSNVTYVVHYNMPKSMEAYYQEAGRAGRDGTHADCIMLYSPQDVNTNRFLIDLSYEKSELDEQQRDMVRAKDFERLRKMMFYCSTAECLRSYILKYFGETVDVYCGNCSNCETGFSEVDITVNAQKILSCIARTKQRYGVKMICDVLRGVVNNKIVDFGLNKLSTYGIMQDVSEKSLKKMIDSLLMQEYIRQTDGEYPLIVLTEKSKDILFNGEKIVIKIPKTKIKTEQKQEQEINLPVDSDLYAILKELRMKLARRASVPAYVVFADATLVEMCQKKPETLDEFARISGVGQVKLERYGQNFIDVIAQYNRQNNYS